MGQAFFVDAIKLLRQLTDLTAPESSVLSALQCGAEADVYWDTINRVSAAIGDDFPTILHNIMVKAKGAGFEPALNALKEKHNVPEVVVEDAS